MPLDTRSLVVLSLAAAAACSTGKPPEELVGVARSALTSLPALPSSGTANYKFLNIAPDGAEDPAVESAVAISGAGATRTLVYDVLGNHIERQVRADGRQPDSDTEQQAYVRVFGALPPAGTQPQVGASWDIGLPAALSQRLVDQVASGFSSTRPVYAGTFTGFLELGAPADFAIVRATVRSKQWGVRPAEFGGVAGLQPGLTSIGVVDLAVGTGAFTGIIPLRAVYFSDPAGMLADTATWEGVAAGAHMTDIYCLTSHPGVPSSLIASIPDIAGAPSPAVFSRCTH